MIDYITREFAGGRDMSSARKRHLRVIITMEKMAPFRLTTLGSMILFYYSDAKGIDQNVPGPRVISLIALEGVGRPKKLSGYIILLFSLEHVDFRVLSLTIQWRPSVIFWRKNQSLRLH